MAFRLPSANSEYALFNLAGEVGELMSKEAKLIRDGTQHFEMYREGIKKELGDILWCLAAVASDYKMDLGDIATENIRKLTIRKQNNTIQGNGDFR